MILDLCFLILPIPSSRSRPLSMYQIAMEHTHPSKHIGQLYGSLRMGNLRELVTTLDVLGMDKDNLFRSRIASHCNCSLAWPDPGVFLGEEKIHISGPRDVDEPSH